MKTRTIWRLDWWDDLQIHCGLVLLKRHIPPLSWFWSLVEFWVVFMFLQIMYFVI